MKKEGKKMEERINEILRQSMKIVCGNELPNTKSHNSFFCSLSHDLEFLRALPALQNEAERELSTRVRMCTQMEP